MSNVFYCAFTSKHTYIYIHTHIHTHIYICILIYVCINVVLVDIFSKHNCPGNLNCLAWQCLCEAVRNVALRRNFLQFDISVVYVLSELENANVNVLGALQTPLAPRSQPLASMGFIKKKEDRLPPVLYTEEEEECSVLCIGIEHILTYMH